MAPHVLHGNRLKILEVVSIWLVMKSNYTKTMNIQIPFYNKNVLRENVASLTHVCWRGALALAEMISMKAYRL